MTFSANLSVTGCNCSVCNLVNAAPILRSSSILAATAFACFSSISIGLCAAWMTCARSVLLNLALLTTILRFPLRASVTTSEPICSPSRSQSVQMNK
jgi:hypothetical protein